MIDAEPVLEQASKRAGGLTNLGSQGSRRYGFGCKDGRNAHESERVTTPAVGTPERTLPSGWARSRLSKEG